MKKSITCSLLYLSVGLIYLPSLAFVNRSELFLGNSGAAGTPVAYLNIMTPDGRPHQVDEVKVFSGKSQTAPCSDLQVVYAGPPVPGLPPGFEVYIVAQEQALSEADLQHYFALSPVTCVQFGLYYKGTAYLSAQARVESEVSGGGYTYSVLSPGSVINLTLG